MEKVFLRLSVMSGPEMDFTLHSPFSFSCTQWKWRGVGRSLPPSWHKAHFSFLFLGNSSFQIKAIYPLFSPFRLAASAATGEHISTRGGGVGGKGIKSVFDNKRRKMTGKGGLEGKCRGCGEGGGGGLHSSAGQVKTDKTFPPSSKSFSQDYHKWKKCPHHPLSLSFSLPRLPSWCENDLQICRSITDTCNTYQDN